MKLFGIADLHLSFSEGVIPGNWDTVREHKPMGIFGEKWSNHYQKIYENWVRFVKDEDIVLVPGDISWGLKLEDALHDLEFLAELPGKIILVQGNHDYWWQSVSRVRKALPSNVLALQNNSFTIGEISICGTRGWTCPHGNGFTKHDEKIYLREIQRLELSLKNADSDVKRKIVMMHFMPVNEKHEKNEFIELMQEYNVELCIYGHLHSSAHKQRLPDHKWGINFSLVSADYLNFLPELLWEEK